MKKSLIVMVLGVFLSLPCALCAEELEIQLVEIAALGTIEGENPLDDPYQSPKVPTQPTDFRATIDGNLLTIIKQEETIPSAQAVVINVSTGGVVINRGFSFSMSEQIANAGVYVLRIGTANGDLVGHFIVL